MIVTISTVLFTWPSFTIREKTSETSKSSTFNLGAVNVGCATVGLDNVTVVPDDCVHAYVIGVASMSLELDPSSVTNASAATV